MDASDERLENEMFLNLSSMVGWSSWASRLVVADRIGVAAGQLCNAVVTGAGADAVVDGPAFELSNFFNKTFWCSTTPDGVAATNVGVERAMVAGAEASEC